jgi:hypothetical protein
MQYTPPLWRSRRALVLLAATLCLPAAPALAKEALPLPAWTEKQDLPPQWTVQAQPDKAMVYRRKGLSGDAVLGIWATDLFVGSSNRWHDNTALFEAVKEQQGTRGIRVPGVKVSDCDKLEILKSSNEDHEFPAMIQMCTLNVPGRSSVAVMFSLMPGIYKKGRFVRVLMSDEVMKQHALNEEMQAVLKSEQKHWKYSGGPELLSPSELAEARDKKTQAEAKAAKARQIHTPGRGLKPGDYETVLFSWDGGGGSRYTETIYLLLEDGTAYPNLAWPPGDFDAQASKRLEPDQWVQWRKKSGAYQVRYNKGEWQTLEGGRPAQPGGRNETLDKRYTNHHYANGPYSSYSSQSSYVFSAKGRFERTGYAVGSSSVYAGDSTSHSTHSSGSGTSSTNHTTTERSPSEPITSRETASGSTSTKDDGASNRGTYRIDQWTLELRRDDGVVERHLFLHSGKGINVGGVWYGAPRQ